MLPGFETPPLEAVGTWSLLGKDCALLCFVDCAAEQDAEVGIGSSCVMQTGRTKAVGCKQAG